MKIFFIELLSRYPTTKLESKKILRLPQIIGLRFKLFSVIKPTFIIIKNNAQPIFQQNLTELESNLENKKEHFFNIWLNLAITKPSKNTLSIHMRFFGILVKVASYDYIKEDYDKRYIKIDSDSYIDPQLLPDCDVSNDNLVTDILSIPRQIRTTSIHERHKEIKSFLLMRLDQMGDFILTLPAIHEIKSSFPNAKITIILSPSNAQIANTTGYFDKIIVANFSFEDNTNLRSLSNETKEHIRLETQNDFFDIAVDLSPMPETREILGVINAQIKIGFENTDTSMIDLGLLIHSKDPINSLSNISHANYPLALVDIIKRIMRPEIFHIKANNAKVNIIDEFGINPNEYIVIHSGSRNKLIRWPIDKFVELTNELSNFNNKIILFSDDEINDAQKKSMLNSNKIIIVDYKIEFDIFDSIISNSKLFIGNDSGPKHLAALREIPVISIHSPRTNWSEWGQVDSGLVVSCKVPCAGCAIVSESECAQNLVCIKNISVSDVMQAFVAMTNKSVYQPN